MNRDNYIDAKIAKQKSIEYDFQSRLDRVYREINSAIHFGLRRCKVEDIFDNIMSEDIIDFLNKKGYKLEYYKAPRHYISCYYISW
jgi:hypothetical protein